MKIPNYMYLVSFVYINDSGSFTFQDITITAKTYILNEKLVEDLREEVRNVLGIDKFAILNIIRL